MVVQYETEQLEMVLDCLERTTAHLTAAIVSKDTQFQNKVRRYSIYTVYNHLCLKPLIISLSFFVVNYTRSWAAR